MDNRNSVVEIKQHRCKSKHCGNFRSVAAEALEERKGHDPDIHPELAEKNKYIGFSTAAELEAYSSAHLAQLRDAKGRALRKDAVVMCVTIFKPPAALMETLNEDEKMRFLEDGADKIRQIVGKKNVKAEAWHFDEQGEHVHIFWEPMTEDGRLCAKERHNLHFLNQLNRELPEHLRSKGWDIDDCNAYDAAAMSQMSELEKAQRRNKNGRSSAVYKADAERKLQYINAKIEEAYDVVGESARAFGSVARENVAFEGPNIYDNIIYLMSECDDDRFEELDQEGLSLKRKHLQETLAEENIPCKLKRLIQDAEKLSWQERQRFWDDYRTQSDAFWQARVILKEEYSRKLKGNYIKQNDVLWAYYNTLYCLQKTRSLCLMIIYTIKALWIASEASQINEWITELRKERDILVRNTASFVKFSKCYAQQLKAGEVPFGKHMDAMERIVSALDAKARTVEKTNANRQNDYTYTR